MRKWAIRAALVLAFFVVALPLVMLGIRISNSPTSHVDLLPGSDKAVWTQAPARPNILLLTLDDLNWNSLGQDGTPIAEITPNLDRLAKESLRFEYAFVTSPICQPSRSVWMTGMYPPRNGATGFNPIKPGVATLATMLRGGGYHTGIVNKVTHTPPYKASEWDYFVTERDNGVGRIPAKMGEQAEAFFRDSALRGKPFFLNLNINDPHRPFAGASDILSKVDRLSGLHYPDAPKDAYQADAVPAKKFLPDDPEIRKELAQYYTSVHRADQSVGAVLDALEKSGAAPYTVVIVTGDNGMAFPFAKSTLYMNGSRTHLLVRWPGHTPAGSVNKEQMVAGVDIAPTILDIAQVTPPEKLDGRSIMATLNGNIQPSPDKVFTYLANVNTNMIFWMKLDFTTRAVQTKDRLYIWSPWSNGKASFLSDSMLGITFSRMKELAKTDREVADRVDLYQHRVPEEFFNTVEDPDALHNLDDDPASQAEIAEMRAALLAHLEETKDPALDRFKAYLASLKQ